jgi:DNA-binding transcriptional MerR regulator
MAASRMLRMRELERATGVGRETIRYYIREGLLPEPERRGRNVALYPESFVERIGLIKDLQRRRFLPLQVIKAVLDSGSSPSAAQTQALMDLDGRVFADAGAAARRENAADVAERAGLPYAELRQLADAGVITPQNDPGGAETLGPDDVEIVACWAAMRRAGYSDELGFSPADLRVHAGMLDVLVQEELRMFTSRIGGVNTELSARMAEAGVEQVARILACIRRKKILDAIGRAARATARRTKAS